MAPHVEHLHGTDQLWPVSRFRLHSTQQQPSQRCSTSRTTKQREQRQFFHWWNPNVQRMLMGHFPAWCSTASRTVLFTVTTITAVATLIPSGAAPQLSVASRSGGPDDSGHTLGIY